MAKILVDTRIQQVFDKSGKNIGLIIERDYVERATTPVTVASHAAPRQVATPVPPGRRLTAMEEQGNALARQRGWKGCAFCHAWNCVCAPDEPPSLQAVVERQRMLGLRR